MLAIRRCIALGWAAFSKVDNIMRTCKASMKIERKVLNEYVLQVMTHGSETWALTTVQMDALTMAQRKMKQVMLGITVHGRKHNTWLWQQVGVTDITDAVKNLKY